MGSGEIPAYSGKRGGAIEEQPQSIGRYQVLRKLGHGGMGSVYLAHDPAIDRQVAIKTITLADSGDASLQQEHRQRFLQEAQAAGRLQHPNIISVHDVGTFGDGNLFIVMEYLSGSTLDPFTKKQELLPVPRVISLISDACLALDYAHRHGIVHRDIKPSNLMLADDNRVKITDFGIAKDHRANITQCGMLLGTPNYMSPEQATGDKVDGRSDLFSLGVVLYELLTGERPFQGDSITAVLYQLVHQEPTPPRILNDKLPEQFDDLLRMALHKAPESRFQVGREMAAALRNHPRFEASPAQTMMLRPEDSPQNGPDLIRQPEPRPQNTVMMPVDQRTQDSPVAPRRKSKPSKPAAPPARVAPPRQRTPIIALAGLAVALGALIVPQYRAAWLHTILPSVEGLMQPHRLTTHTQRDEEFAEPSIPAPQPVQLELVADRPDARFYVDGEPLEDDVLPWRPALTGQFLSASDGCFRGEVELALPGADPAPLELKLTEAVVRSVELSSDPAGASILLDGKKLEGRTPASLMLSVCESHEVTLSLAGHQARTLSLPSGGNWDEMTGAPLRLETLPNGRLVFEATYPVTILRKGKSVGRSGEMLSLAPGRHKLTFENKEHHVSVTKTFQVKSDAERNLDAPVPPLGTVRVLAYPGNAVIRVNGVDAEPPPAVLELGAGEHRIECRWNIGAGKTVHKTVLVREGQTHSVHFNDEEDTDDPS